MKKTQKLYIKAKKMIPGGTQLLSKRPELFLPNFWPAYYKKAKGCEVWDLDGVRYLDMTTMGIGACILGFADRDVNDAVVKVIKTGNMSSLNAREDVELAELLCSLHPWADMVRYARTGGEAMAMAVRIARAKTRKDKVLFCGYHGWHDWYLSANLSNDAALDGHLLPGLNPLGVPRSLRGLSFPFRFNDVDAFRKLITAHKGNVCAVVLETVRNEDPQQAFLREIREVTIREGIVLIADEITAGWRLNLGGAHLKYDLNPDISVFAKAISNGYPMAAILGKSQVMRAAQDSFISSTYWTERIGPAAALATIKKMKRLNLPDYLIMVGKCIQDGWQKAAKKHSIRIKVTGIYPLSHFSFDHKESLVLKTLFTQFMLKKGFLASTIFYASYAHRPEHIAAYLKAADESFERIAQACSKGDFRKQLQGPVCHDGFKRLN